MDRSSTSDAAAETPDFTTPNEAYWSGIDALLARLNEHGILAFAFPAYVGYAGNSDQGWMGEMVANGPSRMRAYGEFIAKRYAHQPNIVWMLGGDFGEFTSAQAPVERAFIDGLIHGAPWHRQTPFGRVELGIHRDRPTRLRLLHHAQRRV